MDQAPEHRIFFIFVPAICREVPYTRLTCTCEWSQKTVQVKKVVAKMAMRHLVQAKVSEFGVKGDYRLA